MFSGDVGVCVERICPERAGIDHNRVRQTQVRHCLDPQTRTDSKAQCLSVMGMWTNA
jgi:hypothetical protein